MHRAVLAIDGIAPFNKAVPHVNAPVEVKKMGLHLLKCALIPDTGIILADIVRRSCCGSLSDEFAEFDKT
jgi:hypothetical protein